ncbi:MAG: hypothetical protein HQL60_03585 [Magnetococcales bacterium]|nr:hypothetical protein [Magnetococcales bacterium]
MTSTPDNPWGIRFMAMFHMSNDSHLFRTAAQLAAMEMRDSQKWLPLYEAKMVHQFDHRWATYADKGTDSRDVTLEEKNRPDYAPLPRYWVAEQEVESRLRAKGWSRRWLMGWRDICRSTDERTVIAGVVPRVGCGDTFLLMFPSNIEATAMACLLADQNSLAHDYASRQKIGGTHLKYHVKQQLATLTPKHYAPDDIAFITPRVLELVYTAHDMRPFAEDLGYQGPPFGWDVERRAMLRAELDAHYARLYGLSRDELRYILDPAEVMGPDYPSETFRVLKNKEMKLYGEYRTARLVLAAWDKGDKMNQEVTP